MSFKLPSFFKEGAGVVALMRLPPVLPHPDCNGEGEGELNRPFHLFLDPASA